MAPFRPSGRSNRSGRTQADHDVFEGLPIKQWRQAETTVGLPQAVGDTKPGDNSMPELPMPRDSHLLSTWTQSLLREARRPRLAARKDPTEDEKGEDEEEGEKELQTGFLAKKWAHVPPHLEEPEREYIAKRRKGLPSMHTTLALQAAISIPATTATRTAKVMKADADGKTTIYEVLVPEGQVVEGEVKQDTEMPDAAPERAAPGTVIEGVGIANAEGVIVANDLLQPQPPPRRRNMPPKRVKKGGPGRGKKKVMFTAEGQPGTSTPGGTGAPSTPAAGDNGAGEPMDIDSARKEDDDGEDDDDDDDDREDGEVSDAEAAMQETPSHPAESGSPSKTEEPQVVTKTEEELRELAQEAPQHENETLNVEHAMEDAPTQESIPSDQNDPTKEESSAPAEEASKSEPATEAAEETSEAKPSLQESTDPPRKHSDSPEAYPADLSLPAAEKTEVENDNVVATISEGTDSSAAAEIKETDDSKPDAFKAEESMPVAIDTIENKPDSIASEENKLDTITSEDNKPDTITSEENKPDIITSEENKPAIITSEEDKPNTTTSEEDKPDTITSEDDNPAVDEGNDGPASGVEATAVQDTMTTKSDEQPAKVVKDSSDALSGLEAALNNQNED